jgi:Tol biopolymer transport system component
MTPEQWQKVRELLAATLEQAPAERAAFLDRACDGDEALRREVLSLVASYEEAGSFIESPARALAAELLLEDEARLAAGQKLGHYRILSLLGRGGMGEVYLAEDTRLDRRIALKLLPARYTEDPERLRRFIQEAKAASALNHPNIITIHDIGVSDGIHYIATEFIDGETLRQRLARSGLKLREALEVASQVAAALQAAHEASIIHRDIKPENIMLRRDGYVKVLDFGLAKLVESRAGTTNPEAAKRAMVKTKSGVLLGTVTYMSPEQARGIGVSARADIFSLGVVLYEMVAGRAPFAGATTADVIAAILDSEPPPLALFTTEAELERIIGKALRKDPAERYQDVGDLLLELKNLKQTLELEAKLGGLNRAGSSEGGRVVSGNTREELEPIGGPTASLAERRTAEPSASDGTLAGTLKRHTKSAASALGLLLMIVVIAFYQLRHKTTAVVPLRIKPFTSFSGRESQPAFSPDGKQIAFVWDGEEGENRDIYVKLVGLGPALRLTTDPAYDHSPTWSPDGRQIAFLRRRGEREEVLLTTALGGAERKLAEVVLGTGWRSYLSNGLSWSPDGEWLALVDSSPKEPGSIFLLSLKTGERRRLTTPPASSFGDAHPVFAPDGLTVAFARGASSNVEHLYFASVAGGAERPLAATEGRVFGFDWTPDGHALLYSTERAGRAELWRVAATGGAPEQVKAIADAVYDVAVARQGAEWLLAYSQREIESHIWRLALDHAAAPARFITSSRADDNPQFSPDGRHIAFSSTRTGEREIWVAASDGSNPLPLTNFNGPSVGSPRWSPDSQWLAFDSLATGNSDIYIVSVNGGAPRRLTTQPSSETTPSWSRDGQWVYFCSNRSGEREIWKVAASGGAARQLTTQGGFEGFESPDGQYFYYAKRSSDGIFRVPVAGGPEEAIPELKLAGYNRDWALHSTGIYFIPHEAAPHPTIHFFDFATRQVRPLTTLTQALSNRVSGLTVSPDGRWLLYAQVERETGDILLVENFR